MTVIFVIEVIGVLKTTLFLNNPAPFLIPETGGACGEQATAEYPIRSALMLATQICATRLVWNENTSVFLDDNPKRVDHPN